MGSVRRKLRLLGTAFGIESQAHGDRLYQSRFSRAVFADEEGNVRVKLQRIKSLDARYAERIDIEVLNISFPQFYLPEIRLMFQGLAIFLQGRHAFFPAAEWLICL